MEQYSVTGMSCAACQARVEKAVSGVPGVETCSVSLLTNSMGVEGTASAEEIIQAVEKAGYGAKVKVSEEELLKDRETPKLRKRLIASVCFLVVLMYFSMGHHMLGLPVPGVVEESMAVNGLIQMVLALVVMFINRQFFISGFKSLISRAPNMDTLVAMGSGGADPRKRRLLLRDGCNDRDTDYHRQNARGHVKGKDDRRPQEPHETGA